MSTIQNKTNFIEKNQQIKDELYKNFYNPRYPEISYIVGLKFNRIPKLGYYFLDKMSNEGIFIKYHEYNYAFINYLPPNKLIELNNTIKDLHHHFIISVELFDEFINLLIENIDLTQLEGFWFKTNYIKLIMKYINEEMINYPCNTVNIDNINSIIEPPPGLELIPSQELNIISHPPGLYNSPTLEVYTSRSVLTILEIVNDKKYKCNLCNSSYTGNYYKVNTLIVIKNVCIKCYNSINLTLIKKISL